MKKTVVLSLLAFALVFSHASVASAAAFDPYIWQKPTVQNIDPAAVQKYSPELTKDISQIVNNPPLAPLIMHYSDQPGEGYEMYHERGRIITTIAMAYPYMSTAIQTQIKTYVKNALASGGAEAFWSSQFKGPTEGFPRRLNGNQDTINTAVVFKNISTLHVIYGLWLYGDKTGDWTTVQNNWTQIKTFYQANKSNNILYGSLDGYIAMIRLAQQFGDTATVTSVSADLNTQFTAALNPTTIETRQKATSYAYFYEASRRAEYFPGQPWMYLNASPEVLRFIGDNATIKNDYLSRLQLLQARYSPWWLYQLPIFTRWTGDEGIGTTPELMGMSYPAERWIKQTPPAQLDLFMKSIPVGLGDAYWIESLIGTLEANGQNCWTDIRDGTKTCGTAPSASPSTSPTGSPTASVVPTPSPTVCQKTDINQDGFVDISDYVILAANFFKSPLSNARADINNDAIVDLSDYSLFVANYLKSCAP